MNPSKKYIKFTLEAIFLFALFSILSCENSTKRFKKLPSKVSGIHFSNDIPENLSYSVLDYYFFSGAGVSIGDINNDGLNDIYFSGNLVSGELYLNKGNLEFENITSSAGIRDSIWGTGAVMEDVNQDGLLDIYVCASGFPDAVKRKNLLFINNGDLTFTESAEEFGLDEDGYSTQAVFFDYDKDDDLDVLIARDPYDVFHNDIGYVRTKKKGSNLPGSDKLFRNDGNNKFKDISQEAGILDEGYSLGVAVSDINKDGWPDIYISNDFQTDDILYTNNKDGSFDNETSKYLKHTEFAGMGVSIADINNDSNVDIFVADMMPEDNERLKMIIPSTSYDKFNLTLKKGYLPQYSRNVLQLNNGNNTFSEIGQLLGVHNTDWSWAPLIADFDNDGDRDFFVTNGLLKDIGNLDFIHYQPLRSVFGTKKSNDSLRVETINKLSTLSIKDYFFENQGSLKFTNKTTEWGIEEPSISHGAAYGDLDNDGDLDIVINTINEEAIIYVNQTMEIEDKNYLKIKLKGPPKNKNGIGTVIETFIDDESVIFHENYPCQGYLSTVDNIIHFGLGENKSIDSVKIKWIDGKQQVLDKIKTNQTLVVDHSEATNISNYTELKSVHEKLFSNKNDLLEIDFIHSEDNHTDFKLQPILLKEHSRMGPGIAVGDLNGDGIEDFVVGNASGAPTKIFLQNPSGKFDSKILNIDEIQREDMGILVFDADNDLDNDIYVVSGGTSFEKESINYSDRLYINDGKGNFILDKDSSLLPNSSGASVSGADFDKDGDLDLFVCGHVIPGEFPLSPKNYLLVNTTIHTTTEKKLPRFLPADLNIFPFSNNLGMISSALWTDFNNDGWTDLICVGEWNSIIFLENRMGVFHDVSDESGIQNSHGWWNSITSADFDNDGDIDYIAGNNGLNTRFKATKDEPLSLYSNDYDKNGRVDPIISYYINGVAYPAHTRSDLIRQINATRNRFKSFLSYAKLPFDKAFLPQELNEAELFKCEILESVYIENLGNGSFKLRALPIECQFSPVFGMVAEDFNDDGNEDILMVGNLYSMEVGLGRSDASNGLLLLGDGNGKFEVIKKNLGYLASKDAKALVKLNGLRGESLLINSNNNDKIDVFEKVNSEEKTYKPGNNIKSIFLHSRGGKSRKKEFYYGSSYLSQSSRSIKISRTLDSIDLNFIDGTKRTVNFKN